MDYGLDAGALALAQHVHQQQQQEQKPANQEEDCFHTEGDDNFKVDARAAYQ